MARKDSIRILVVGAGSVGTRHATNLLALGCEVTFVDTREDRRKRSLPLVSSMPSYGDLDEALRSEEFGGAVIATPTSYHPEHAQQCLAHGLSLLIEKPLGSSFASAAPLRNGAVKDKDQFILLGYTWRWRGALRLVRQLLLQEEIGTPLHARLVMASHLADWHPWESYQDFYMADASLGGGALLDESHWLDLAIWFFGLPTKVVGSIRKISSLDISSDDNVDALLFYDPTPQVVVHLDLFTRPARKELSIVGTEGSIRWSEALDAVRITTSSNQTREYQFASERNEMFLAEAIEFVSHLTGSLDHPPSCGLEDGLKVLRVIEALRLSDASQTATGVL